MRPDARLSLTAARAFGGTVAKTSATSVSELPFWEPARPALTISTNFSVRSASSAGIEATAATTSARNVFWSAGDSVCITAVISLGFSITRVILALADASVA